MTSTVSSKTIILPRSISDKESLDSSGKSSVSTEQSLLLIGANGSGKTRLGAWLDRQGKQQHSTHRVSAQKTLSMPDSTTPQAIKLAENNLLYGHATSTKQKASLRWNSKPAIAVLNDFNKLLVFLFSDETESNARFKAEYKQSDSKISVPKTKLDILKEIWETILPNKELIIGGLSIQTKVKNTVKEYKASEMSDGERVIFYLIGQCLAAPKNGMIIIDEPELHLHKSIQFPLWSKIEKERSDCLFVYLTHDVDFAAGKVESEKIWLKSFDGENWDWEIVGQDNKLPDDLLFEILGSRKPVVFVEGDNGSLDVSLYREILANYLVIPKGGCQQVIQAVKAFKQNSQLHHLDVCGMIDRDRRSEEEIAALVQQSIYVLDVAEVENLFCVPEVLALVSKQLERDSEADVEQVKSKVFESLKNELETQVSLKVVNEIRYQLNLYDDKVRGKQALADELERLRNSIDSDQIYDSVFAEFQEAIDSQDYRTLLKVYNRKSLANRVGEILGLAKNELPKIVLRMIRGSKSNQMITAISPYLGNFPFNLK